MGNHVWLKVAPVHCDVLWHIAHVCGNPACTWFGFVVLVKSVRWQVEHAVPRPAKTPFTWHVAQATGMCAPVSGKFVVLWLNVAPDQVVVEWHVVQSVGEAGWAGLGLVGALE